MTFDVELHSLAVLFNRNRTCIKRFQILNVGGAVFGVCFYLRFKLGPFVYSLADVRLYYF